MAGYLRNLGNALIGRTASAPPPPVDQAAALATIPHRPTIVTVGGAPPPQLERAYGPDYGRRIWPNEQQSGVRTPWVPATLRWLPEDVEAVWADAEIGNLYQLASLCRGMRLNGTIDGLMSVRSSIVRLPIVFVGDPWLCAELRGVPATYTNEGILVDPGVPGAFERMCPAEGLKELIYTGTMAGVAPFEMVPGDGPDEVLTPRDLHFLRYDWGGRQWTFQGGQDVYRWEPGNGRQGLFSPGGIDRPWQGGAWLPCAFPHVAALAALFDRLRWQALLADPLKYIKSGPGASQAYLKELQWFIDTQWARAGGIALPPGYEAGYAESSGKGWEVYIDAENRADRMVQIALAGQVQTVDGGSGFSNLDLFDAIAESFIQDTATSLARCLTKQVIEPWVERRYGLPRSRAPKLAWDIRSPKRKRADADHLTATSAMIASWNATLQPYGERIKYQQYLADNAMTLPVERIPSVGGSVAPAPPPEDDSIDVTIEDDPVVSPTPDAGPDAVAIADPIHDEEYGQQQALADGLYGIKSCAHGLTHRCERCGVRRVYPAPVRNADGSVTHPIVWRPISAAPIAGESDEPDAGEADEPDAGEATSVPIAASRRRRNLLASAGIDAIQDPIVTDYQGLTIIIDRPVGFVQTKVNQDGSVAWTRTYTTDYGYLPGTAGGDADELDCFVGTESGSETVYWFSIVDESGAFDEYKIVFGAGSRNSALGIVLAHIPAQYVAAETAEMTVAQVGALLGLDLSSGTVDVSDPVSVEEEPDVAS